MCNQQLSNQQLSDEVRKFFIPEKKIKIDDGMSLLVPQKNYKTRRDSKSSCSDNKFETLSEIDDNVEENVSRSSEDKAVSNISFISARGNLKSTRNPILNNYCSKVQNTERSLMVETNGHDDIDLFFLSMSKTVKKLPHHEQVHLKKNISNLVFEAELKVLKPNNAKGNNI